MADWLSYRLTDFLLFAPQTYFRLFERFNTDALILHGVLFVLGGLSLWLSLRRSPLAGRLVPALLALMWAWSAYGFVWRLYLPINWAAAWLLPLFVLQTLLLLAHALRPAPLMASGIQRDARSAIAALLMALALLYPALAPLSGRDWIGAEFLGSAPDPTAIATLALVLLTRGRWWWSLLPLPVGWCAISALTLWALGAHGPAWFLAGSAALAVAGALVPSRPSTAGTPGTGRRRAT